MSSILIFRVYTFICTIMSSICKDSVYNIRTCRWLTHRQLKTHGRVIQTVASDVLVLNNQVMSYNITSSLIGWAHSQNYPFIECSIPLKQYGHDGVIAWKSFPRYWPFARPSSPTMPTCTRIQWNMNILHNISVHIVLQNWIYNVQKNWMGRQSCVCFIGRFI